MNTHSVRLFGSPWIWLRRFRHRCGYGVHSPFAFGFITDVVYERAAYYAYDDLDKHLSWPVRTLNLRPRKCLRFLFRLANYVHPPTLFTWHASPLERTFLQAGCTSACHISLEKELPSSPIFGPMLLYLGTGNAPAEVWQQIRPMFAQGCALVIVGIHRHPEARKLWHSLADDPIVGARFDLYDYGVAFFDPVRNNQHYLVNF